MRRLELLIVLVLMAGLVSAHGINDVDYDGHHGMMGNFYAGFGMGAFGFIFMILIVVVLVLFIIWLAKQLTQKDKRRERRNKRK